MHQEENDLMSPAAFARLVGEKNASMVRSVHLSADMAKDTWDLWGDSRVGTIVHDVRDGIPFALPVVQYVDFVLQEDRLRASEGLFKVSFSHFFFLFSSSSASLPFKPKTLKNIILSQQS